MRNMAVLHSPAFSYPLPVLVRVLSNLLIFKGKILYYNKDKERQGKTSKRHRESIVPWYRTMLSPVSGGMLPGVGQYFRLRVLRG